MIELTCYRTGCEPHRVQVPMRDVCAIGGLGAIGGREMVQVFHVGSSKPEDVAYVAEGTVDSVAGVLGRDGKGLEMLITTDGALALNRARITGAAKGPKGSVVTTYPFVWPFPGRALDDIHSELPSFTGA